MSGSNQDQTSATRNDGCPCCNAWQASSSARSDNQVVKVKSARKLNPSVDFGDFYVLRNAFVWTLVEGDGSSMDPTLLDVWVGNGKILALTPPSSSSMCPSIPSLKEIDLSGMHVVPGFVDIHVHADGGGGETGFGSRTPEANSNDLVEAGVTTFVSTLGTDTVARGMENLIAKTRSLASTGLTGRAWLGGYHLPIENSLTGSIRKDLTMIPDFIGVGELAISDHRGSFPSTDELTRLCSEVRVAGMISGSAGVTYFHLGDLETALQPLRDVVERNPVLLRHLVPTHMERTPKLILEGKEWMKRGGFVDFSCWPDRQRLAIQRYTSDPDGQAMVREQLSISSDSYGSISVFDENGIVVEATYGKPSTLLETLMALVYIDGLPLATALRLFSRNPARVIQLDKNPMCKGKIQVGGDADLLVLNLPDTPLPDDYPRKRAFDMDWPSIEGVLQYVIASGSVLKCAS